MRELTQDEMVTAAGGSVEDIVYDIGYYSTYYSVAGYAARLIRKLT